MASKANRQSNERVGSKAEDKRESRERLTALDNTSLTIPRSLTRIVAGRLRAAFLLLSSRRLKGLLLLIG